MSAFQHLKVNIAINTPKFPRFFFVLIVKRNCELKPKSVNIGQIGSNQLQEPERVHFNTLYYIQFCRHTTIVLRSVPAL